MVTAGTGRQKKSIMEWSVWRNLNAFVNIQPHILAAKLKAGPDSS